MLKELPTKANAVLDSCKELESIPGNIEKYTKDINDSGEPFKIPFKIKKLLKNAKMVASGLKCAKDIVAELTAMGKKLPEVMSTLTNKDKITAANKIGKDMSTKKISSSYEICWHNADPAERTPKIDAGLKYWKEKAAQRKHK